MLTDLIAIHEQVIATLPGGSLQRYLFTKINWDAQSICIVGGRGVGKTTLMCQYLIASYKDVSEALYISADNIHVLSQGLFSIAQEYFKFGGKALFIDEVHKYPDWSREIKNIIDTYRQHRIVFSASSSLNLHKSKYDLSRRVVYYELKGLSFREYLHFSLQKKFAPLSLTEILTEHMNFAAQFKGMTILKHFRDYLTWGYYPFFLEGLTDYPSKASNIIEKVLFEDIAVTYNLRQTTVLILKKLLWLITTANGLLPNIDRISKSLGISREVVYNCLEYLDQSGLINNIYSDGKGMKLIRKPAKIYLENTNLLAVINGSLNLENDIGGIRETFFVNQVGVSHKITLPAQGDFIVDNKYIIEVGGPAKDFRQIKAEAEGYLAIDEIEIGFAKKIPLYLFGFLY